MRTIQDLSINNYVYSSPPKKVLNEHILAKTSQQLSNIFGLQMFDSQNKFNNVILDENKLFKLVNKLEI